MFDIFAKAKFIRLGFNPFTENYYVDLVYETRTRHLILGPAIAAVHVFKANSVTHFDYATSLSDNHAALARLAGAAGEVGFEI